MRCLRHVSFVNIEAIYFIPFFVDIIWTNERYFVVG